MSGESGSGRGQHNSVLIALKVSPDSVPLSSLGDSPPGFKVQTATECHAHEWEDSRHPVELYRLAGCQGDSILPSSPSGTW